MAAQPLILQLRGLHAAFARVAPSEEAVEGMQESAQSLVAIARGCSLTVDAFDTPEVHRAVVGLASRLEAFSAVAQRPGQPHWAMHQVYVGLMVLDVVAKVALQLQLSVQDRQRMAGAAALALGAGLRRLEETYAEVVAMRGNPLGLEALEEEAGKHVLVIESLVLPLLEPSVHPQQGAAAFAAGVGKPAAIVPWLAAVCRAMTLAATGPHTMQFPILARCLGLVLRLSLPPFREHSRLLASTPDARQAVAAFVLHTCLPAQAAIATREAAHLARDLMGWPAAAPRPPSALGALPGTCRVMAASLSAMLSDGSLLPAFTSCLSGPGSMQLAVQQALSIALALPVSQPEDAGLLGFCLAHSLASSVVESICSVVRGQPTPSPSRPSAGGGPAGSSSSSSSSSSSAGRGPEECRLQQQREAAWELVRALPGLAQAMAAVAAAARAEEGSARLQDPAAYLCKHYGRCLPLLDSLAKREASAEHLSEWLDAADAGARLAPLLIHLDASWRQLEPALRPEAFGGAAHLAARLTVFMWDVMATVAAPADAISDQARAAYAAQPRQLGQLLESSCRLVHVPVSSSAAAGSALPAMWATAEFGEPSEHLPTAAAGGWLALLKALMSQFVWTLNMLAPHVKAGAASERCVQGMCAAHKEALLAVLACAARSLPSAQGSPSAQTPTQSLMALTRAARSGALPAICPAALARSLLQVVANCPAAADRALLDLLREVLAAACGQRDQAEASHWVCMLGVVVRASRRHAHLAACLTTTGVLAMLLEQAAVLDEEGIGDETTGTAYALPCICGQALLVLDKTAASLLCAPGGPGAGTPPGLELSSSGSAGAGGSSDSGGAGGNSGPAELQAWQQRLAAPGVMQRLLDIAAEDSNEPVMPRQEAEFLGTLLPAAADLAALLLTVWEQQPGSKAQMAVELSLASATRSCANLRCANPATVGGKRNPRCSGCRTVRYCCRQCSVADWRPRHKLVCKVLAAQQQAEQEAAAP